MQEKYGFVYVWMDKKKGRFYVGSHWGHEKDGYVCSSRWMRNAYKRRPGDFKRRIVFRTIVREDLLPEEGRWLQMIKREELGVRYYNLNATVLPGHWSSDERSRMTVGQKLSVAGTGKKFTGDLAGRNLKISLANTGKRVSEETKAKLREANLGKKQSAETLAKKSESMTRAWETRPREFGAEARENMRRGHLGRKLSPEHLAARSKGQTGLKRSAETRAKMSASRKRVAEEKGLGIR